ncbi:MAG: NAD(P)/FAD-dependent oxidoreductase [Thermoleophilia bacterium]
MTRFDAVVLGAGPAGLGAALALARGGARVAVIEGRPGPGGLCVTRRRDGLAYDVGGHIPFVRDEARRRWLIDLLGNDLVWVDRPVSCVVDGSIVRGRYLDQMPDGPVADPAPDDGSARGEVGARVGAAFADRMVRPYLEKVDGLPLERIPAERSRRLREDQAAPDGFWFPASGIGQMMDAMAAAAQEDGAELLMETRVAAIHVAGGGVTGVSVEGPPGPEEIFARHAVVAIPPGVAARTLEPAPPAVATRGTPMRAVAIVYLALERDRLTEEPWIQVADPRVPFARAFEPVNWSPRLAPAGRTVVGLECYCEPDRADPVWGMSDDRLAEACAAALADPLGWLDDPAAASPVEVLRIPAAYPLPDIEQQAVIRAPVAWLEAIEGLHVAPGAAVIEAIESGERAAEAILSGLG